MQGCAARQGPARAHGIECTVTEFGGWKGVRRTFLDKSITPPREWVAVVATSADGMVIITSNEVSPPIAARAPVYKRILRVAEAFDAEALIGNPRKSDPNWRHATART